MEDREFNRMLSELGPRAVIKYFFETPADKGTESLIELLQELILNPDSSKSRELLTGMLGSKVAEFTIGLFSMFSLSSERPTDLWNLSTNQMSAHVLNPDFTAAMVRMGAELSQEQQDTLFNASLEALAAEGEEEVAEEV